jgi:hypothetical protein
VNRRLLIVLGVALALVCVCGGVLVAVAARSGGGTKATQTANAQFMEPLQAICSGQGGAVAGAGAYAAGAGIHPVMVFRTLNGTNHNRDTRVGTGDWSPKGLSEAQLVACTEDTWVTVESCPYTSKTTGNTSTLIRSQNQVKVRLFAAQSGKSVATQTLLGTDPRECLDTETFTAGATSMTVSGEAVTPSDIQGWLKTYVAP